MKGAFIFTCALLLAAGAGVTPPRIGCMIDGAGRARVLYGIAGTFLLGSADSGCVAEPPAGDRYWTTRREAGRWWLIQIDRESGGETERAPLDERIEHALALEGAAVTGTGNTIEYRGRQWELPSRIEGLHRMSSEWVQVAAGGAAYAIRPASDHQPYLLPGGDSE